MNYIDFTSAIRKKVDFIYIVSGEDMFLMDKVQEKLTSACEITVKDIDQTVLDAENFSVSSFEKAYVQLPLMSKQRLVIIRFVSKLNEADKKQMKAILSTPSPSTCVICFIDENSESFSFVDGAQKIDCSRLSPELCAKFIDDKVNSIGYTILTGAKNALISLCSRNLGRILSEITKLSAMSLDTKQITEEDVEASVKKDLEYQIYEISDCLLNKNINRAIEISEDLIQKKEEPTMILSLLTSYFRRLYYAKISAQDNAMLAKSLGVKEFAIKIAREKQAKLSALSLKQINELLLDLDYSIKTGQMQADIAVEYALLKIYNLIK